MAMDDYAAAAEIVRQRDRDRYLADLYAPAEARRHLFALQAFAAEIARVPAVAREPTIGEIRLQWWRDAIARNEPGGHPVAAALIDTVRVFDLPRSALDALIEARVFDLYDDPMPTLDDLEGYAGETSSSLLQFATIVLNGGKDAGGADASGHGGVAETLIRILGMLASDPRRAAKYVPDTLLARHGVDRNSLIAREDNQRVRDLLGALRQTARRHLDAVRAAVATLPAEVMPAYLPLALVGARLDRMDRHADHPYDVADLTPWRRQWTIWRAARAQR